MGAATRLSERARLPNQVGCEMERLKIHWERRGPKGCVRDIVT